MNEIKKELSFIIRLTSHFPLALPHHSPVSCTLPLQAHLGYKITGNKIRPKVKTIRSKWCEIDKVLERRTPAPVNRPSDRSIHCVFSIRPPSCPAEKQQKPSFRLNFRKPQSCGWMQWYRAWTKWLSGRLYVNSTKTMFMYVYRR